MSNQWEEFVDKASGDTYYSRVDGSETVWDLPEGAILVSSAEETLKKDINKADVQNTDANGTGSKAGTEAELRPQSAAGDETWSAPNKLFQHQRKAQKSASAQISKRQLNPEPVYSKRVSNTLKSIVKKTQTASAFMRAARMAKKSDRKASSASNAALKNRGNATETMMKRRSLQMVSQEMGSTGRHLLDREARSPSVPGNYAGANESNQSNQLKEYGFGVPGMAEKYSMKDSDSPAYAKKRRMVHKLEARHSRRSLDKRQNKMQEENVFPVKEALKGLYRVNRWKTLFGASQWLLFLFLLFVVLSLVENKFKVFEQESALEDLFLDEEFQDASYKKNFHEIYTVEELWDWLEGPLLQGAYAEHSYNGAKKGHNERGYILDVMKLVGGIRIRQHRVEKDSCASRRFIDNPERDFPELGCVGYRKKESGSKACYCNASIEITEPSDDPLGNLPSVKSVFVNYPICPLDRLDEGCYDEYITDSGHFNLDFITVRLKKLFPSLGALSHETHPPIGSTFVPRDLNRTGEVSKSQFDATKRYRAVKLDSILLPCRPHFGKGSGFGAGLINSGDFGSTGYYQDLPTWNKTRAKEILLDMKNELWIDKQTRAVAVTFNVYNTMTRYITVSRLTIEIGISGRIFTRGEFFTFPSRMYSPSSTEIMRFFFEIVIICFYLYFIQKEARKAIKMGFTQYFCMRKSTIVEWLVLFYIGIFLAYFYYITLQIQFSKSFTKFHVMDERYHDFAEIGRSWRNMITYGGLLFLVSTIKLIKFLALSKQAMLLFRTVSEAAGILSSFLITMGTLLIFFALAAHYVYGNRIPEFQGYAISLLQMLRWILGDVDYARLDEIRPDITPYLYTSHQIIFFFLATNMLIAIVISQFDTVRVKAQLESKWKREVPSIFEDTSMRVHVWCFRCCRRCHRDNHALRLVEMKEEEAKAYVRQQKTRNKYGELVKSSEWYKAYNRVVAFWQLQKELEFQEAIRSLQRFGKSFDMGGGVRLYEFLESLYNQWEERATDAIESGILGTNDTRVPIACISAERLAFFVCKTESFEMHLATRKSRLERKKVRASKISSSRSSTVTEDIEDDSSFSSSDSDSGFNTQNRVIRSSIYKGSSSNRSKHKIRICSCEGNICIEGCNRLCYQCKLCFRSSGMPCFRDKMSRVEKDEHYEDLGRQGLWRAQMVVKAFNRAHKSLIVAPIVAHSSRWTNDESIVGEKLRLVIPSKEMRLSLFDVRVTTGSVISKSRKRNAFIDKGSAQLYILEPCDIRPSTTMELDIYTSSSELKPGRSSWSDADLSQKNVNYKKLTAKATGPIKIIVDLLDLQQIQTESVSDKTCTLCFDDRVGRSFRLTFNTKSLLESFIDSLVQTCEQFSAGVDSTPSDFSPRIDSKSQNVELESTRHNLQETKKNRKPGGLKRSETVANVSDVKRTRKTLLPTLKDRGRRKQRQRRSTLLRQSADLSQSAF